MTKKRNQVGLDSRYQTLAAQKHEVEGRIGEEMKRPLPDLFSLQGLKRKRLMLKDEMAAVSGVMRTVSRSRNASRQQTA